MNAPGDYEGIDMAGIDPRWYESHVPAEDQRTFIRYDRRLRYIRSQRTGNFLVVAAVPRHREKFSDSWLVGWGVTYLRRGDAAKILDAEGTLAELRAIDRMKNFASKKAADEAVAAGWEENDRVRLATLSDEVFAPAEEMLRENARKSAGQLEREIVERKDTASGKRHVRRGRLFVPAGGG